MTASKTVCMVMVGLVLDTPPAKIYLVLDFLALRQALHNTPCRYTPGSSLYMLHRTYDQLDYSTTPIVPSPRTACKSSINYETIYALLLSLAPL